MKEGIKEGRESKGRIQELERVIGELSADNSPNMKIGLFQSERL